MNKKQYDLRPCKNCGDITCSGQCNWLKPFAWACIIAGGVLMGWILKSLYVYLLN